MLLLQPHTMVDSDATQTPGMIANQMRQDMEVFCALAASINVCT
jgi:hypothetical protein